MYVIVKDENGTRQFWAGDHWQREYGIVKYESQADAFAVAKGRERSALNLSAPSASAKDSPSRRIFMARKRKTRDCWRFYVNYGYGDGWEHEITEYTFDAMKVNRKAYRENCKYPLRIKRGREKIEQ